jgi:hypothetical protein
MTGGVIANLVYVGTVAGISFWFLGTIVRMRPTAEEEVAGLDPGEMGVLGYSGDPGPMVSSGVPAVSTARACLERRGTPGRGPGAPRRAAS